MEGYRFFGINFKILGKILNEKINCNESYFLFSFRDNYLVYCVLCKRIFLNNIILLSYILDYFEMNLFSV